MYPYDPPARLDAAGGCRNCLDMHPILPWPG
jgi:hypothetical protein